MLTTTINCDYSTDNMFVVCYNIGHKSFHHKLIIDSNMQPPEI